MKLIFICVGLIWSVSSQAITPKQMYGDAETCYKKLRHSQRKIKYRDNWMRCIEKFQKVHRLEPTGPWAAAGLFKSGKLYQELAKRSGKKSDYQEAREIFERIVRQYPKSGYRGKAAREIQVLSSVGKPKKIATPKKSIRTSGDASEVEYKNAESCYNRLRQNAKK